MEQFNYSSGLKNNITNNFSTKAVRFCILIPLILLFCFTETLFAQAIEVKMYSGMKWRLVGPYRAGWATMAEGIPGKPNTYYFGAAGGGVWKTSDAGRTWHPQMQQMGASSVGALAISASDPDIIYVGTGQVALRYDILAGNGVYRSADAGKTWENIGLKNTRHIGRIVVDPKDPDHVVVAALGHIYESNTQRGVFLTKDGGKTWNKVLYVNDSTGAVDLAFDPKDPSIIYAAMWQMRVHPWLDYYITQKGPGSGIYKSTDGGEHWNKVPGKGLPKGDLGRIGLGLASGSNGKIIYATIIASSGRGLYRSEDGGINWQLVNDNTGLANSYFSRITVDPNHPNIVYVMGRSIRKSTDGGKHFSYIKGAPGGDDYHFLWINPEYPSHMITASDQGCVVTVNGGKSWSSWYNQPTGQFYHLAADNQFPFKIYSGQQDNGTVGILSQGPYGVIEDRDWHPVGGEERDFDMPKPGDPDMVFGSGLGGPVTRFDEITRQVANVSPWPISSYGDNPSKVKYRYTWITPLVFSHLKPYPLYFANQYLFSSVDNGDHWKIISPDLTGKIKGAPNYKIPDLPQAKKAGYGVIYTISPSPVNKNIIWIGTDDGLIQVTKDGGRHWKNVTPEGLPLWGRIDAIDPSPFSKSAAYAAVNTHRLGNFSPLIYKTTDFGKSWTKIIKGLPANEYVNSVRTDSVKEGLLFASTNRSVYVSFNDGGNWHPLTLNFPTTCVRDLLVHDNDLIAGTQGRGIWILDDLEPLREISAELPDEKVHLFKPAQAWRMRGDENQDTPWPPSTPLGQNPPNGAIIDYWLNSSISGGIKIIIRDSKNNIVNEFKSGEEKENLPVHRYFQKEWVGNGEQISDKAGMHRFVWDLRYKRPQSLQYHYSIAAVWDDDTPVKPEGSLVLPGIYKVTLFADGNEYTKTLTIKMDPRVRVSREDLVKQLNLSEKIDKLLAEAVSAHNKIKSILNNKEMPQAVKDSLISISDKGKSNISSVTGAFSDLLNAVDKADAAPTQGQKDVFAFYKKQLNLLLNRWRRIENKLNLNKS